MKRIDLLMLLLACFPLTACSEARQSEVSVMRSSSQAAVTAVGGWAEVERRAQAIVARAQAEDYFDSKPQAALASAAARGDVEAMKEALAQGADVNAVGNEGITPLFWAMIKQNVEGYTFLLEQGADPNLNTPPPRGQGYRSPIELAAAMPQTNYLEAALEHGGDPNKTYSAWDLPIIYQAIMHRQLDNVQLLIQNGAQINYQDRSGGTPIIEAVTAKQFEIALYLLRAGADPTLEVSRSGSSAVDFVKRHGNRGTDRRTSDLAAFDEFVRELKDRDFLEEDPPRFD